MRTASLLAFLGTSLVATACMKSASTDVDSANSVVDDSDSTESEGNVMMAAVDGSSVASAGAVTGDAVAARIAANVDARWNPSGCAVATASGSNVSIKLNDCTGPRGLLHVTGELDLAVTVDVSGNISVHATASDLSVNRATLSIDATGDYAISGTQHTLNVQSTATGVGPRGTDINHQGDYTISWDPTNQCRSITGMWKTDFSNANRSAERSNDVDLSRCGTGCPTGMVTHHFLLGATLTINFDGSNVATWSTSTGKSGSINLACQ
jgi:hypothetical protein